MSAPAGTSEAPPPELDLSRVMARAGRILRHDRTALLGLGLVLFALPNLVFPVLRGFSMGPLMRMGRLGKTEEALMIAKAIGIGSLAVGLAALYLLQAGVTQIAVDRAAKIEPSFRRAIETALRHALPLIGLALTVYICTLAGLVLLIVPGVILWLMWSVVVPVRVVEGLGLNDCLNRSAELTKHNRRPIAYVTLAFVAAWVVLEVVMRSALVLAVLQTPASLNELHWPMFILVNGVETLVGVLAAVGVASLYVELRMLHEGLSDAGAGNEGVAEIFS